MKQLEVCWIKSLKISIFIALLLLTYTSKTFAEERITFSDINSFGWEYVGETVVVHGIITRYYAAMRAMNRGRVAANTKDKGKSKIYDTVVFEKKFKSRQLKPFLYKCVRMTGKVEARDYQVQGAISKKPLLVVSEIDFSNMC